MASLSLSRLLVAAQAFLVLACTAAPRANQPRNIGPAAPIPLHYWTVSKRCGLWFAEPATLCQRGLVLDYNGCKWDCVPSPIEGARM